MKLLNRMTLILLFVGLLFILGCPKQGPAPIINSGEKSDFDQAVAELIKTINTQEKYLPAGLSPVAVLPGSLKTGRSFNRLEEVIMERLSRDLATHHELVKLPRDHWFEYREERPLDTSIHAGLDARLIHNITIYDVQVSADDVLEEANVQITGYNSEGRSIAGLTASTNLDFRPGMLARKLFEMPATTNPFPLGMEENPYTSVDRLCFSLSSELADSYRTGIKAGDQVAADKEIKVLLYVKPRGRVSQGAITAIANNLQQAVVSNRGFTCVVSKDDFGPAFEQVDFYKHNYDKFDMEDSRFLAGTVFLMADVFAHPSMNMTGVALRAIWRISPLEDNKGRFLPEETAGTYLSGFTAKAYLTGESNVRQIGTFKPLSRQGATDPGTQTSVLDIPVIKRVNACFYNLPQAKELQIAAALKRLRGVDNVERDDASCGESTGCVCYALECWRPADEVGRMLFNKLSSPGALSPYKLNSESGNRFNMYFRGGFD